MHFFFNRKVASRHLCACHCRLCYVEGWFKAANDNEGCGWASNPIFCRENQDHCLGSDGADAEIKLYVDQKISRPSRSCHGGAQVSLAHLPGAEAYSQAHGFILASRFAQAEKALNRALKASKSSPFLKRQVRYVLAMVIATQVKIVLDSQTQTTREWASKARTALQRAIQLAPSLRAHLATLLDLIESKPLSSP